MAPSRETEERIRGDETLASLASPNYLRVLDDLLGLIEDDEQFVTAWPAWETRHNRSSSDGLRVSFFVLTSHALYVPVTERKGVRNRDTAIRIAADTVDEFTLESAGGGLWALDFFSEESEHLVGVTLEWNEAQVDLVELTRTMCRTLGFADEQLPNPEDFEEPPDEASSDDYDDESEDEESEDVLAPFETANPWLNKVFSLPAYGRVPARAVSLLREISPDPDERIVAALHTKHGSLRRGYLIATTKCLRYIQTLPTRADNFWGYDYKIEVSGGFAQGGVITTASDDLFQTRWGKARQFRDVYAAMQQAAAWDAENSLAPTPVVVHEAASTSKAAAPSLSGELERLAALHEQGVLTDEEFNIAKRRVLEA